MKSFLLPFLCCSLWSSQVMATPATDAAKADGYTFGTSVAPIAQAPATHDPTAATLPGYVPGAQPQEKYYTSPDTMASDGTVARTTDPGAVFYDHNLRVRPPVDPKVVAATVKHAKDAEVNPLKYVSGYSQKAGGCQAVPPASGISDLVTFTCNRGDQITQQNKSCPVPVKLTFKSTYSYSCSKVHEVGHICLQYDFRHHCTEPDDVDNELASGCDGYVAPVCTIALASKTVISQFHLNTAPVYYETYGASCSAATSSPLTGKSYLSALDGKTYSPTNAFLGLVGQVTSVTKDPSQCTALASDSTCKSPVDVCTDSTPQTRIINGTSVTLPCWGWTRTYACTRSVAGNDCAPYVNNPQCLFQKEYCISETTPCHTYEREYLCPGPPQAGVPQYICNGDIACVEGNCDTVDRMPSTEFGTALAGLNGINSAAKSFDPSTLRIFDGARSTCHKPVFGLANCCGGNGFPLVGGCSSQEAALGPKIDKGLCHYVGTWCSKKALFVCASKSRAYCCYGSKIVRIITEQGFVQLSKTFGDPKTMTCTGFTLSEFQSLDFSKMDFSSVQADLIAAAKLPNEVSAAADIQAKIKAYYAAHGH